MNSNLEMLESKIKKLSEFAASRNYDAKQMAVAGTTPQSEYAAVFVFSLPFLLTQTNPHRPLKLLHATLPPSSSSTTLLHPFTSTIPTI
jgi:hypothetical protein